MGGTILKWAIFLIITVVGWVSMYIIVGSLRYDVVAGGIGYGCIRIIAMYAIAVILFFGSPTLGLIVGDKAQKECDPIR